MKTGFLLVQSMCIALLFALVLGCAAPPCEQCSELPPKVDADFSFIVEGETSKTDVERVLGEAKRVSTFPNGTVLHGYRWDSVNSIGKAPFEESRQNDLFRRGAVQERAFYQVSLNLVYGEDDVVTQVTIQGPMSG
jgi:hypothetical protein